MGGTTGRRRRPHLIQYSILTLNDPRKEDRIQQYDGDPIGVPSFGTNHGSTDSSGMAQILYRRDYCCSRLRRQSKHAKELRFLSRRSQTRNTRWP